MRLQNSPDNTVLILKVLPLKNSQKGVFIFEKIKKYEGKGVAFLQSKLDTWRGWRKYSPLEGQKG
jgi:hypothetical protein